MEDRKEQEHARILAGVRSACALTLEDLEWRPYYPNNMLQSGQEGWYCVIQGPNGEFARKYTIRFQRPECEDEDEDEEAALRRGQEVDRYILFERSYMDHDGRIEYPEPTRKFPGHNSVALGVNDVGSFVYAHKTLEQAKKRALWNYQAVYGYAMSHMLGPEDVIL